MHTLTRRGVLHGAALTVGAVSGAVLLGGSPAAKAKESYSDGRWGPEPRLVVPGLVTPPPFMTLEYRKADADRAGGRNNISEGTFYGMERGIHGGGHDAVAGLIGNGVHNAIDANLPYGAPIIAPADGVAFRTYQSWLTNIVYSRGGRTGRVGFGLGLWLIILYRVPGQNEYWWSKIAHCSWIDPSIRYLRPWVDADGDWHEPSSGPDNLYIPDPDLWNMGTPVQQGDVLARVGDTGVEWKGTDWGWRDNFDVETGQVIPRDRTANPPWDPDIHSHHEVYRRFHGSPASGETLDTRRISIDPFGRYGQVRKWEGYSAYAGHRLSPGHVMLTDQFGRPRFAA